MAEHRVRDRSVGDGIEVSTGTWFGAGVRATFASRGTIAVGGRSGVLHPGRGATLPRDVAELSLDGTYRARAWLDVVGGVRVRSYTTAVARQRWIAPYLGVAARLPFAVRGLRGMFDVALHPFASVSGLARPAVAITSGAGVAYSRGRIDAQLRYTLERYDFARGTASQRLEQLSAVTFSMQVRVLGRTP